MLLGRHAECQRLDALLEEVRRGASRALLIRGEPGIGKSALLEYLVTRGIDCWVVRGAGAEAESEFAFAGLHQLCRPLADRIDRLPAPQRDALATAFGLRAGPPPDRFLVGLAVLGLFADAATERPLLCLVDDAQWLDTASAQTLSFVARRLTAESVALLFAERGVQDDPLFAGLPWLALGGLPPDDARALLATVMTGPLDERVRDRLVAETHGNPLALLELPQGLSYAELAGGFGVLSARSLTGRIEDSFLRRLSPMTPELRRLLLVAAVEPAGSPALVRSAAQELGINVDAVKPEEFAGLLTFGARVTFRHPLVRSAIYRAASVAERREAHRALAEVTDPGSDADRRAWHRAQAASGPDESVAAALVVSADRARARGGLAAAAAFLERATALTPDPTQRATRALAAANTAFQAGNFTTALLLLTTAGEGPLSPAEQGRLALLQGYLAFATSRGGEAPLLLMNAAKQLEDVEPALAQATYLDALNAAMFAGPLASPGGRVRDIARAASSAPSPASPRAPDLLLAGLATNFNDGYAAAAPILRSALASFGKDMTTDEELHWLWLINEAALHLWDDEQWDALSDRFVRLARSAGALSELPLALSTRAYLLLFTGDWSVATSLIDEGQAVTEATGSNLAPYAAMALAAFSGREAELTAMIEMTGDDVRDRGEGIGIAVARWTQAVLGNGLGRYSEAVDAALEALHYQEYPELRYPGVANWAVAELVEAAALSGRVDVATDAFEWIAAMTSASRTEWALGLEARSRALISRPEEAEPFFREAVDRLGRAQVRTELARAQLLYGEWLRRRRRRVDAREQLRLAHDTFIAIGAQGFADRARLELVATGETARKRTVPDSEALTAREAQVARLASDGLSNPEIGTRLLLSPRTVEYHLGHVFTKLGITSRHEIDRVLLT